MRSKKFYSIGSRLLQQQSKKGEQSQLPKLVSSTYTDLMKGFQPSSSSSSKEETTAAALDKPKVRKLMDNPFEHKKTTMAEDASKKSGKGFTSNGHNR